MSNCSGEDEEGWTKGGDDFEVEFTVSNDFRLVVRLPCFDPIKDRYPIDPVGGHMLYPGILAMQV